MAEIELERRKQGNGANWRIGRRCAPATRQSENREILQTSQQRHCLPHPTPLCNRCSRFLSQTALGGLSEFGADRQLHL